MADPATTRTVRTVLADDHAIFRNGLRLLVESEPNLQVVGEAASASEAVKLTRALEPDLLLLDVAMPLASGIDALRELGDMQGRTRVLLLTAAIDRADIVVALQLGARGLVLKESATELLIEAIRTVIAGQYWVGRDVVSDLVLALGALGTHQTQAAPVNYGLTEREMEITSLVVAAASNKQIGHELGISEKTVKHHLTNIFDKLGVSSRLELAIFAVHNLKSS